LSLVFLLLKKDETLTIIIVDFCDFTFQNIENLLNYVEFTNFS